MHLDESYFTGYQTLVWIAVVVAGLSAFFYAILCIASIVRPTIRTRLKVTFWPVFAGIVFCGVLFSLMRLFNSREWVTFSCGIFFLILLGTYLADRFLSGLKSVALRHILFVLGLFFLIAHLSAPSIGNTVYNVLPMIIGSVMFRSSELMVASRHQRWSPAVSAMGLLIAGSSAWVMFSTLADDRGRAFDAINLLSAGTIAIGLSRLAVYGKGPDTSFSARVCNWVVRSQSTIFVIGAAFGLYFSLIRPAIVDEISFAPLVEWAIVCLVVWYIYGSSKAGIEAHSPGSFLPVWEKYDQRVQRFLDEDFAYISLVQQEFIEGGQKDGLVVYLTTLLSKMGISQGRIKGLMHPLIGYQDEKSPWYPLNLDHAGRAKKDEQTRRKIVGDVLASLEKTVDEQARPQRRRYKWRIRL